MPTNLEITIDELQRVHRAFALSRDREEVGRRLRDAVAQARRLLHQQPDRFPDDHVRYLYKQLHGYTLLAEASLRGHEPAA